jgi:hypothetical protein
MSSSPPSRPQKTSPSPQTSIAGVPTSSPCTCYLIPSTPYL